MMLSMDRHFSTLERAWFSAVMNTFGCNSQQRRILKQDLTGSSVGSVEEIYRDITHEKDKAKLLNFLAVAMNVDKVASPKEKEFYQKIKDMDTRTYENPKVDYSAFGKALLERDKDIRLWQELGNTGKILTTRLPFYYSVASFDRVGLYILIKFALELLFHSENRLILWLGIFFAIALGIAIF